jgi:lauroyl/myristoyl acyltransferase
MNQWNKMLEATFRTVWKSVAKQVPLQDYLNANQGYRKYFELVSAKDFGARILSEEEVASLPDNSSDYESVEYAYSGLENVRAMLDDGEAVAFVTWHHGARQHADYALLRVFPETVIFTRKTFQYGKIFSYPMLKGQALSLLKMERLLEESTPILYYLDGPPLGKTIQLPMFGILSSFSTSPIVSICSIKGVKIIPVTNYYQKDNTVKVIFHPPLQSQQPLNEVNEKDVLSTLVKHLEADQRKRAPEQVMWWFLPRREQIAQQMKSDHARKGQ